MRNNKIFFITVDTEEDNQWLSEQKPTTYNVQFLPRFQKLAESYGFKPTWLTTYNMASDKEFINYFKQKQDANLCEIGMHLHAWDTPPNFVLSKITDNRPYLVEYPIEVMEEKIKTLDQLLVDKFQVKPISHRAGRWAMNKEYFELIEKYGYKIDTSITPGINWSKCLGQTGLKGSNYMKGSKDIKKLSDTLIEIPVTIRKIHTFRFKSVKSIKQLLKQIKLLVFGKYQWIRPDSSFSVDSIFKVIRKCNKNQECVMFMIHSSELMPGR